MLLSFKLNGQWVEKEAEPFKSLLDFLREDMNLTGTKKGCAIGECGACTVLVNKKAVNSCMVMTGQVQGQEVTTIEGVSEETLKLLQDRLLTGGAVQCGFCTPGIVMAVLGMLQEKQEAGYEDVKRAIDGNLCRCTGYNQIIDSFEGMKREDVSFK
jgi:carbon-monoxide dehydrogenase small subunit